VCSFLSRYRRLISLPTTSVDFCSKPTNNQDLTTIRYLVQAIIFSVFPIKIKVLAGFISNQNTNLKELFIGNCGVTG
jgi:hypothetical protein